MAVLVYIEINMYMRILLMSVPIVMHLKLLCMFYEML
jgi:hypothetical protein